MPEHKSNIIGTVVGMKGSGKSYLMKQVVNDFPRVLAIDSLGEYDALLPISGFTECVNALVVNERSAEFKLSLRTLSLEDDIRLLGLVGKMSDVTIIIEEAPRYVGPQGMPLEIEELVRLGRHRNINQFFLAQRASMLHRDMTAMSDIIVSFHQHEPRDIAYLRMFMGDMAEGAPNLHNYESIVWGPDLKMPWAILKRKYNAENT